MIDLSQLYRQFVTSSQPPPGMAPSQQDPTWQDEFRRQMDPETMKRQNIAKALVAMGSGLSGTPGNFLTGLARGTSMGANSFVNGVDEQNQQKRDMLYALGQDQQNSQDRSLAKLKDTFLMGNDINQQGLANRRADNEDKRTAIADRRAAAYDQYMTSRGNGTTLTAAQQTTARLRISSQLQSFMTQSSLTPDDPQVLAKAHELYIQNGFDPTTGEYVGDQAGAAAVAPEPDAAAATGAVTSQPLAPPEAAIAYLREHPEAASDFDLKYGQGSAASYLSNN